MIEARERSGRHVEEALVFRNHPQWDKVDELLRSGAIGRPLAVQGTIAKQFLDPNDIRNNPALGGGATYDLGPYVIGACNLVFGRAPLRVVATMDQDPLFGIDRLTTALLDYGDAQASFTACSQGGTAAWATHQPFSILGSKGWLRCNFPYAQAKPTECHLELGNETSVGSFPHADFHLRASQPICIADRAFLAAGSGRTREGLAHRGRPADASDHRAIVRVRADRRMDISFRTVTRAVPAADLGAMRILGQRDGARVC